ncbi:MAG: hypothetical protein WB952_12140 [Terriglobales bacterium]
MEAKNLVFFTTACIVFASFAVHYWLPFRYKEFFWIAISLLATTFFLPPGLIVELLGFGALFYMVLSSRMAYGARIAIVATVFVLAMASCADTSLARHLLGRFAIPPDFWPVFGSIFMFRLIIYAHDVRYMKERPSLREYLAYFFILPNYYFQLFPVIDFKTMRLGYYRRDIHDIAQQGIQWMGRGTLQLILYTVVNSEWNLGMLNRPKSFASLLWVMVLTFLLYLRVSGQFHIVVGMLHLFGYDLPETNHRYLLARSLTDFWRRINIYWKDFMVKIVYFPTYFKFRKRNEMGAKLLATGAVFVVTWFLHSYQSFWLQGKFELSWPDTIFWAVLGGIVILETWRGEDGKTNISITGWRGWLRHSISVAGTACFIITIWSLWNSPTIGAWLDLIRWWRPTALN